MKHTKRLSSFQVVMIVVCVALVTPIGTTTISAQPSNYCTGVCDIAWSPDGNLLGAVNEFGLWLYSANENEAEPLFFPHENATSLNFNKDGNIIAVTACPKSNVIDDSCRGTISLFDLGEQSWESIAEYNYWIGKVEFTPDSRYVAFEKSEPAGQGIQLVNLVTYETISIVDPFFTFPIIDFVFNENSTLIAISTGTVDLSPHNFNGISLWRLSDQTRQAFTENAFLAPALIFEEATSSIIFAGYDTQISFWNYTSDVITLQNQLIEKIPDYLNKLSFSDYSSYLAASLLDDGDPGDRMLFVWDYQ